MKKFLEFIEWPAAAMMTLAVALSAQAQEEVIVNVDSAPAATGAAPELPATPHGAAPSYWIGILGGEVSPALRAQLGLEGAGVLVREVVPDSPAAEAGIQKFDVLLTANGKPATDMSVLAGEVNAVGGTEDGKIILELLRAGGHQKAAVVPVERPDAPISQIPQPGINGVIPKGALPGFDMGEDGPFRLRLFGPGVTVRGGQDGAANVNATSVQVQTQNGHTHVKVTHNGQTWDVDSGNPESLDGLPPELRPTVEGLLKNPGPGVDLNIDMGGIMPRIEGMFENFQERRADRVEELMQRQLERMQRQLEAMQRELAGEAPPHDPQGHRGFAPAFEPPAPPAAELELPAEEE